MGGKKNGTKQYLFFVEEGSSSGFLAQKARELQKKGKIDATIVKESSESEVTQYLPKMDILCILSHYEFRLNAFEDMAAPYNIPVSIPKKFIQC